MIMDIQVHAVHFKADQKLIDFVNGKVAKLQTFFDNIISSEVYLRLEPNADENKIAEVKIMLPGKEIFARKQCKTFEEAADLAVEALRKQVHRHKEKV